MEYEKTQPKVIMVAGSPSRLCQPKAEIQAIDDGALETVVGQSSIVIEESIGTGPTNLFDAHDLWSSAG